MLSERQEPSNDPQEKECAVDSNDTKLTIDLDGQVAIVTGGARGTGRAIAQGLAGATAQVAVVARTAGQLDETVALIEKSGGRAISFPADVTDQQAIERIVVQVEERLGPVDLLVNNAGIGGPVGPAWGNDPDAWWRCIEVNLCGPFLCSRAVLPGMIARRRGRIVNVPGAASRPRPYASALATGKTALVRFSENLAAETEEHGIRVFAIHPGLVRTDLTEGAAESPEFQKWFGDGLRRALAEGRAVPPERAADLVVRLASGQADALSGCSITVDDDVTEMIAHAKEIRQGELYTMRLRTEAVRGKD
jgi:NAD(P)-dependent dehydrogenase (short-subunit alcohol dehydrogenase family)